MSTLQQLMGDRQTGRAAVQPDGVAVDDLGDHLAGDRLLLGDPLPCADEERGLV
ncbi:MAG TPA: hypothetical protein VHX62_10625 [Solirubrobacteraceae bacterium]|nr:hypothetical protein [Solirubrobacteraceae bacterium]